MSNNHITEIEDSLQKLRTWATENNWSAYDTFDGLSSPLAPVLTLGTPLLRQFWQQGVRRFPFNLRPLLLIRRAPSSKGMGFFAQGYLRLFQASGDNMYLGDMRRCLDWLMANRCPQFEGNCWGNHFDYQARGGRIPKGTPSIVWTSLIGQAFLDAYEALGEKCYLDMACGVAHFIENEIGWIETDDGICLNYIPANNGKPVFKRDGDFNGIHNSSVLGASLLARVGKHRPNRRQYEIAENAMQFTARDQLPSGAWNYGLHPKFHWVDSFHTGYVLESFHCYMESSGNGRFKSNLENGYRFFLSTFFDPDGTPRYYDYKRAPIDIQCSSQAIQTLTNLYALDAQSIPTAVRVALWTINNMQDASGYFYYRKYPLMTNTTPTLHWGQATMFAALSTLLWHLQKI